MEEEADVAVGGEEDEEVASMILPKQRGAVVLLLFKGTSHF